MFTFLLGTLLGTVCVLAYGAYHLMKLKKLSKELEAKAKVTREKIRSIKDRLVRVQEITKLQLDLVGAIDQPSKNALHSRYKNGLNEEIKLLEEEKLEILKSILRDGFDPVITVVSESQQESIKLSEYMAKHGFNLESDSSKTVESTSSAVATEENKPIKRVGNFAVYCGGKTDDSTTH